MLSSIISPVPFFLLLVSLAIGSRHFGASRRSAAAAVDHRVSARRIAQKAAAPSRCRVTCGPPTALGNRYALAGRSWRLVRTPSSVRTAVHLRFRSGRANQRSGGPPGGACPRAGAVRSACPSSSRSTRTCPSRDGRCLPELLPRPRTGPSQASINWASIEVHLGSRSRRRGPWTHSSVSCSTWDTELCTRVQCLSAGPS